MSMNNYTMSRVYTLRIIKAYIEHKARERKRVIVIPLIKELSNGG